MNEIEKASTRKKPMSAQDLRDLAPNSKTAASELFSRGSIPAEMKAALDEFSAVVSAALRTNDNLDASKVEEGRKLLRDLGRLIPKELQEVFVQIVGEEVGARSGLSRSFRQIGADRGFANRRQASASGATQVYDVVALISHLSKVLKIFDVSPDSGMRRIDTNAKKPNGQQRDFIEIAGEWDQDLT